MIVFKGLFLQSTNVAPNCQRQLVLTRFLVVRFIAYICVLRMISFTDYGRPVRISPFTAQPKINSHSQIFRYGPSIFCLPDRPNFSEIFDLCLHWVSVVRDIIDSPSRAEEIGNDIVKIPDTDTQCLCRIW